MIKTLPLEENPREKAIAQGVESLSNVELLAVLLRTGTKEESVLDLSARLLKLSGGIENLRLLSYQTLIDIKGIKTAKAVQILAAIELARRMQVKNPRTKMVRDPAMIYHYLTDLESLEQEHFVIIILDSRHRVIVRKTLFIGSINASLVDVREIFVQVLKNNGVAFVAAHNHPSGDAMPSHDDLVITRQMQKACETMDIEIVDHIIIGHQQYYSILKHRLYCEDE